MEALVSREGQCALILGKRPQVRALGQKPKDAPAGAPTSIFAGCSDVRQVTCRNATELDERLADEVHADQALRVLLVALDPDGFQISDDALASGLNQVLCRTKVYDKVDARLYADSFSPAVASRLEELKLLPGLIGEMLSRIAFDQHSIAKARESFERLAPTMFGSTEERQQLLSELVIQGSFRQLARALTNSSDIDFTLLELRSRHRSSMNATEILNAWIKPFRSARQHHDWRSLSEEEVVSEYVEDRSAGLPGRRMFESVMRQQAGIVDKLKLRDFESARRFAEELVREQSTASEPAQLAKSLSRLSNLAKQYDVPELQLEWAEGAVQAAPTDALTYGHLADALIGLQRYAEAGEALSAVEANGERLFALNGRARIARAKGNPQEALKLNRAAIEEYRDADGVEYSFVGEAESLRDMQRLDEALKVYTFVVERWPLEATFWTGLASTLMEMGRFREALETYNKAQKHDLKTPVADIGRAQLARLSGRFEEAASIYMASIVRFPNNPVLLCGLGDTYRLGGLYQQAMAQFEEAQHRAPFSTLPLAGKAKVYRDQGQYADMHAWLLSAMESFPQDPQLKLMFASTLYGLGRIAEAERQCETLISELPNFTQARMYRADLMRRTGRHQSALLLYTALRREYPHSHKILIGEITCLMAAKRLTEADRLLPSSQPKSQNDWTLYQLRAFLSFEQGAVRHAMRLLERGIARTPFVRQAKLMRNTLAYLQIRRGEYKAASRNAQPTPGEPTNVIYVHALAAAHETVKAVTALSAALATPASPGVRLVYSQIGGIFALSEEKPQRDKAWLTKVERTILLEAA